MDIRFSLRGRGWLDATVSVRGRSVSLTGSYLSEPLKDLLGGLLASVDAGRCTASRWITEPGELRLSLIPASEELGIRVVEFEDVTSADLPEAEQGDVIFDEVCPTRDFVAAVLEGVKQLLDDVGGEGEYVHQWGGEAFPATTIDALRERAA